MKVRTKFAVIIFLGALISGNAMATGGGKTKPPVAEPAVSVEWYAPIIDFFNFN